MKRLVIIIVLIIVILLGYSLVAKGFSKGKLEVPSYQEIEEKSNELNEEVEAYNFKNNTTYKERLDTLTAARTIYESTKEEYDELIEQLAKQEEILDEQQQDLVVVSSLEVYEIDFLWARIGNFAKQEGVTIVMDVTKSSVSTENLGYGFYNLSFAVAGQYIDIADFLYDLEDDDELGFEIRNYSMMANYASFTIYNVPLDSDTLIESFFTETPEETTESTETEENTSDTVTSENGADEETNEDTEDTATTNDSDNSTSSTTTNTVAE